MRGAPRPLLMAQRVRLNRQRWIKTIHGIKCCRAAPPHTQTVRDALAPLLRDKAFAAVLITPDVLVRFVVPRLGCLRLGQSQNPQRTGALLLKHEFLPRVGTFYGKR